jgi:hypothetical protein
MLKTTDTKTPKRGHSQDKPPTQPQGHYPQKPILRKKTTAKNTHFLDYKKKKDRIKGR